MKAITLLHTFDSVYLVAMAAWTGSILFFSFGVAPVIFKVLKPDAAAAFVRALFPRYYAWGAISGAIALPALVCGPLAVPELRGPAIGIQAALILASLLAMLYCGNVLTPAINQARDAGPEQQSRFERLHQRSVTLNSLVLVIGIGLIVAHAYRPTPRTQGIVEPSPEVTYREREFQNMRQNQAFWEEYGKRVRRRSSNTQPALKQSASAPDPEPARPDFGLPSPD